MKIAFLLYKYFPYGGLQRDFYSIAEKAAQRGHEITCYTREWEGEKPGWLQVHTLRTEGVTNIGKDARFVENARKQLATSDFDCTVAFNRVPGVDVYFAADPCFVEQAVERSFIYKLSRRYRYRKHWEAAIFQPASQTHIMVLTRQAADSFQRIYGTPSSRMHVLPPNLSAEVIQPSLYPQAREEVCRELDITAQNLLLSVASAFSTKGLDRVLKALAALPADLRADTVLLVAGEGNIAKFRKLARKLGVAAQVYFLGGREDVPRLYAASDVLVHPARLENSGTVLLEAMAMGLPVITTSVCGNALYVEEAEAGVVLGDPFNQREFDSVLADFLHSPARLAEMRAKGLAFGERPELYQGHDKAVEVIETCAPPRKKV